MHYILYEIDTINIVLVQGYEKERKNMYWVCSGDAAKCGANSLHGGDDNRKVGHK